jgi:hypothetical protein
MKKFVLFILFSITIQQSYSCDICGCSSGNYFIGPFPQFNKHFVGMRYSFQNFNTVLNTDNSQFSKDFYQSTELLAGTKIYNKWQLLIFLPYNNYQTKSDDGIKHNNGLGDMTLIGNFNLLDKKTLNSDTETVFQQLWVGAGLKFPTGKFSVDTSELVSSANMQPGTGSFDFLLNAIYTLQIESWGFNVNSSYKINQTADNFRFGNRLSLTAFVFRSFHPGKVTVSPNVGLLFETLNSNTINNHKVEDTGGKDLLAALGFEVRYKNIAFGGNAQIPLYSNLSSGQTDPKIRGMCHLSYIF